MQSETAEVAPVAPPGEVYEICVSCLIPAHLLN